MGTTIKWDLQPTYDPMKILSFLLRQPVLRKAPALSQPFSGGSTFATLGTPNNNKVGNKRSHTEFANEESPPPTLHIDFNEANNSVNVQEFEWELLDEEEGNTLRKERSDLQGRIKSLQDQLLQLETKITTRLKSKKEKTQAEEELKRAKEKLEATEEKNKETKQDLENHVALLALEKEKMDQDHANTSA